MKVVILAGGLGTRISEETIVKPKPLIEIGGRPIIWHIMKMYSHYGLNEFIICCGYKGFLLKEYFSNYSLHFSDITIDIKNNKIEVHKKKYDPWKITLIDTGETAQTGGRLKKIEKYVDDTFCMTYGDGVSDIDIKSLIQFHKKHNKLATVTVVKPQGRFGSVFLNDNKVESFIEKPRGDGGWINGGFFVLNKKCLNYIKDETIIWEREPLEKLSKDANLYAFKHDGFWYAMDSLRDKVYLEQLWNNKNPPWKKWNE